MNDSKQNIVKILTRAMVRYSSLAVAAAEENDSLTADYWLQLMRETNNRVQALLDNG